MKRFPILIAEIPVLPKDKTHDLLIHLVSFFFGVLYHSIRHHESLPIYIYHQRYVRWGEPCRFLEHGLYPNHALLFYHRSGPLFSKVISIEPSLFLNPVLKTTDVDCGNTCHQRLSLCKTEPFI